MSSLNNIYTFFDMPNIIYKHLTADWRTLNVSESYCSDVELSVVILLLLKSAP